MLQGWSESQSTPSTSSIPFPQLDTSAIMRDAALMSSGRQRTSQACDKCRERKTKCSGDRPVCKRCTARGLICTYSCREPRSRGPTKPRVRANSAIQLPFVAPASHPKTMLPAPIRLPQVEIPRGTAVQQRISRPLHYRAISMPQRPDVLPARAMHAKASSFTGLPEPSRHFMSHDFSQPQSRRLGSSMFSSALAAQPMVQDVGQIALFPDFRPAAARASFNTNLVSPTFQYNTNLAAQMPSMASLDYGGFGRQFQLLQGTKQLPLDNSNAWSCGSGGSLGFVGRSTPPPLSHSASSSVAHSPSTSSDHDREAHYQSITNFERLVASFQGNDPGFYQHAFQATASDIGFGSSEPSPLCFEVKDGQGSLSAAVPEVDYNTNVELQYPTPVTPIGMEKLETVVDSSTLAK